MIGVLFPFVLFASRTHEKFRAVASQKPKRKKLFFYLRVKRPFSPFSPFVYPLFTPFNNPMFFSLRYKNKRCGYFYHKGEKQGDFKGLSVALKRRATFYAILLISLKRLSLRYKASLFSEISQKSFFRLNAKKTILLLIFYIVFLCESTKKTKL
ncbi:hypothetical protein ACVT38_001898 [Campylobacter coli]